MQRKNGSNSINLQQPNGICHRLYNFIINTLFSSSFKRVTMGQTTDHEILLQDLSRKGEESDVISSEIVVEFRNTEDWTSTVDKLNATIMRDEKKKENIDEIARIDIIKPQVQGASAGEFEATSHGIKGKGPKKTVIIKDDEKDRDKQQQKDKNIPTTVARVESEFFRKPKPPRPRLMSVASNINEKSDAFIKSRKEAMRKNFNLETEQW